MQKHPQNAQHSCNHLFLPQLVQQHQSQSSCDPQLPPESSAPCSRAAPSAQFRHSAKPSVWPTHQQVDQGVQVLSPDARLHSAGQHEGVAGGRAQCAGVEAVVGAPPQVGGHHRGRRGGAQGDVQGSQGSQIGQGEGQGQLPLPQCHQCLATGHMRSCVSEAFRMCPRSWTAWRQVPGREEEASALHGTESVSLCGRVRGKSSSVGPELLSACQRRGCALTDGVLLHMLQAAADDLPTLGMSIHATKSSARAHWLGRWPPVLLSECPTATQHEVIDSWRCSHLGTHDVGAQSAPGLQSALGAAAGSAAARRAPRGCGGSRLQRWSEQQWPRLHPGQCQHLQALAAPACNITAALTRSHCCVGDPPPALQLFWPGGLSTWNPVVVCLAAGRQPLLQGQLCTVHAPKVPHLKIVALFCKPPDPVTEILCPLRLTHQSLALTPAKGL